VSLLSISNSQDFTTDRLDRSFWLLVVLILAVALALRLPGIATRSLWIDELYTEWFASRSFAELWSDVPDYETHPPFYYSLLRLWTFVFGNSELGLRSLSLVFSLATVFAVAVSGRLLKTGRAGLVAGLLGAALLAINYASIREAQNARPYALQGLVSTVAILAALALVERLGRGARLRDAKGGWLVPAIVLGLSAGIGLWIHNTGFFIALGIWSGLALTLLLAPATDRLRQLSIFFAAGVLALLVWAPYLPIFLEQSGKFMTLAFWLTPKTRDLYSAWLFLLGPSWPVLALAIAVLLLGLYRLARGALASAILVAAVLILPLYAVLAFSFAIKPIYIQRLFAWMVPLALLVVALGIATATRILWPRVALALVVAGAALAQTIGDYARPLDDWKAISAEIARNAEPGDVVIAVPAEGSIAVGYYAARHPGFPPVVCVPGCYPQRNLDRTYMSNLGAPKLIEADGAIVDEALRTHKRVWLVQVSTALYDPTGIVRKRIAASRTFVRFTGNSLAKVELFE
jgi:4-amino-4-deoxy-L-arabinose transferase-like glycosyltransferase